MHSLLDVGVQFLTSTSPSAQLEGERETRSAQPDSSYNNWPDPHHLHCSPGALPAHLTGLVRRAELAGLALALGVVRGRAGRHGVLV